MVTQDVNVIKAVPDSLQRDYRICLNSYIAEIKLPLAKFHGVK